jgi:hypothetical protein
LFEYSVLKLHERLSRSAMEERVEWSLTRAALWSEVKDRLQTSLLACRAASSSVCASRAPIQFGTTYHPLEPLSARLTLSVLF